MPRHNPLFTVTLLPWLAALKVLHGPDSALQKAPGALLLLIPPDERKLHRQALAFVLTDETWGLIGRRRQPIDRVVMLRALGQIVRDMVREQGDFAARANYRERATWWKKNVPALIDVLAGPYPETVRLLRELEGMGGFDDALGERAMVARGQLETFLKTADQLRRRLEDVQADPTKTGEPAAWRTLRAPTPGNWQRRLVRPARATLAKAGVTDPTKQMELLEIIGLQRPARYLKDLVSS